IKHSPVDLPRQSTVGLSRELAASDRSHLLEGLEHGRRANRTIEADDVGAPFIELGCESLRRGPIAGVAVGLNSDLGHDRQIAYRANGKNGLLNFSEVGEGFKHEQIVAAFKKGFGLLAKYGLRFLGGGLPVRLDANAQRPDGASDEGPLAGGLASYANARVIYLISFIVEPVAGQLQAVRAVGVGFDDVGACLHIIALD